MFLLIVNTIFVLTGSLRKLNSCLEIPIRQKSRNPHPSCVIYEGVCSCQESQIGKTVRNVEIRWLEHEDTQKDSEPAKHLKNYPTHSFTWKVLLPASSVRRIRQNMEASLIALNGPSLNERVESQKLLLFRNGVT